MSRLDVLLGPLPPEPDCPAIRARLAATLSPADWHDVQALLLHEESETAAHRVEEIAVHFGPFAPTVRALLRATGSADHPSWKSAAIQSRKVG